MLKKLLLLLLFTAAAAVSAQNKIVKYVNPFFGTANGGNTFPGAVVPWGMVSVSPHNAPGSPSGYLYGNKYFYGFGHNHLSGTGCSDLGSIIVTASKEIKTEPEEYKSTYSGETAKPGYYSAYIDKDKIKAEATATTRCGLIKFMPGKSGAVNILVDAGRSLNLTGGGSLKIVSDREIEGSNTSGGFCGEENRQTVYFVTEFSKPFTGSGIWRGGSKTDAKEYSVKDTSLEGWFTFNLKSGESVLVKTAISYVSIKNARENLKAELPGWNFEATAANAAKMWEEKLSCVKIEDKSRANKIKFYSALYHAMIHPNIISDANGDYPLMGRKGTGNNKERPRYSVFSLWDTYRTLHPLLTFLYPQVQSDIIQTMLDMYKENGYLPKWELIGNETYMMTGDPAAPVIADSYVKGISDFDTLAAFNALLKPAVFPAGEPAPPIRAGYHQLLQYKYIPFEQDHEKDAWWVWGTVSTTQEYCLSDWTISRFMDKYGNFTYGKEFLARSLYYRNLFDSTTLFFRPKRKDGSWLTPFNPLETEGSGDWTGSGGPGYVEGNAWHYGWFAPHDIDGMIKLYGGQDKFYEKLLRCFNENHFTINNEPDINYPYLFDFVKGKEDKTKQLVKKIMDKDFGTGADGLPGNDDCGAISAWFVFSALGFYPVCPASINYSAGTPLFEKAVVTLDKNYYPGGRLEIVKGKKGSAGIFLNGNEIKDDSLNYNELVKGGKLIFKQDE